MMRPDSDHEYPTYRREISATWWLKNRKYFFFMMREITSVFVACFVILFLYQIFLLTKGPEVYASFQESLRTGGFITFYVVALIFALYHSLTWFGLAAKIQIVRIGSFTVPPAVITAGAYGSWIAVSILIAIFFWS